MDIFQTYVFGTAVWLGVQSVTLVILPKLAISLLASEAHYATALDFCSMYTLIFCVPRPDLEIYFSRSLGFSLAIIAVIALFFTGIVPLSSSISEPVSLEDGDTKAPYAVPIVQVTTFFHFVGLVYCYVRYTNAGITGYLLGAIGYGLMAIMGGWSILFGTDKGRISKRTGKDKRMSGFPFKNVNEYDKRKDKKMG